MNKDEYRIKANVAEDEPKPPKLRVIQEFPYRDLTQPNNVSDEEWQKQLNKHKKTDSLILNSMFGVAFLFILILVFKMAGVI